ncbi:MAG: NAD(P)/FAD-dependent oxidoreductase [Metallosphaera yellowstonensis]|jgi:electron transfer flavoprotein-quinone oxidoreductase|uniref:Flavin-dependent dehydrogenase n=1 Tax=Metallosphaera yellowstonensis MK1 TaxID=671065 RepID=H2C4T0_9CREN|nr:NAD(P)/FAD-dependent oxidoreductase [Metallosphaera yellowstonensis]EHP69872.1 flavin-dependent dehydrogenase [Metallosphaera yellowstonensis MK1]
MYDVVVVGAGPAGSSAALRAARAGAKTLLLERGPEPGSKNVSGAMVRVGEIAKVFDVSNLPVEREVRNFRLSFLSQEGEVKVEVRPRERLVNVGRLKLDKWMANQAEAAGAILITKTTVTKLAREADGFKVITERGEVKARSVVLAEGVNALVAMGSGLRGELTPEEAVQTVKEVYSGNKDEVSKRFGLGGDQEGLAVRYLFTDPVPGAAFLYTYRDSIAFGIGVHMSSLIRHKVRPQDVLEEVERRLGIQEVVKGFSLREYSAKVIPEGGYPSWRPCSSSVFMAGDALGLVNPVTFNGIGPAVLSGALAGEAAAKGMECEQFERALREVKEVKEVVKLRPLIRELLEEDTLRSYVDMAVTTASSWVSGELNLSAVKRNSWRLFKHVIQFMGVTA